MAMSNQLTITELERRWQAVLDLTRTAVSRNPGVYRQLKSLAADIANNPLDIREYLPTAEKLACLLKILDPEGRGSIFYLFSDRITPRSIWQVSLLRMECKDLLAHLKAFDKWRIDTSHLKIMK
jgi:hypothetical protein